jgi:hypothetical protein
MTSIEVPKGDTLKIDVTVTDGGDAVDVTGYTVSWLVARNLDADPLYEKEIGDGVTVTDAAGGEIQLKLTAAETAAMAAGTWWHRVQVVAPSGDRSTIVREPISILPTLAT